jgi:hypothetical protein
MRAPIARKLGHKTSALLTHVAPAAMPQASGGAGASYERTTSVNSSPTVQPFGSGFAVPPGRDHTHSAEADALARAAHALASVAPGERATLLRELLLADMDNSMAGFMADQLLLGSPEAAAAANGLGSISPTEELDPSLALPHALTEPELAEFQKNGYFVCRNVLEPATVTSLLEASAQVDATFRPKMGIGETERMDLIDTLGAAHAEEVGDATVGQRFLDLLDLPTTFPKVWGLMGSNISLYHTQVSVQPPLPHGTKKTRLGWHRDSGRLNTELEGNGALVSLKVGFFLTDASASTGFTCVPGSHRPQVRF